MKRLAFFSVVLLVAGVFCAAVLADTPPPTTTTTDTTPTTTTPTTTTTTQQVVADGVMLAGLDIGGLTADAAIAAVQTAFAQPLTVRFEHSTISVSPTALGMRVSADTAVARALTVAPGTSLALRAGYDKARVKSFVARVAKRFDRKPESSRLLLRSTRPLVTKPVVGRTLDRARATAELTHELVFGTRGTITLKATLKRPPITPATIGPIVVIKRSSNVLTLYDGMRVIRRFHVATGQSIYPTPIGRFQIVVKWKNPWWYPPNSDWAKNEKPTPPGPGNPLGTRWMGIDSPGVGIHGTPESGSIGYSLSHGCIRMLIPEAEWLFDHVNVGTPVFIISA